MRIGFQCIAALLCVFAAGTSFAQETRPGRSMPGDAGADGRPPFLEPWVEIVDGRDGGAAAWDERAGLPDWDGANTAYGLVLRPGRRGGVGAIVRGVEGARLDRTISFDYRNDGACTETSPTIVVTFADRRRQSFACASGRRTPAVADPENWTTVTFAPPRLGGVVPPISDIRIVFNERRSTVVVDNFRLITFVIGWPGLSVYVADTGNHRIARIDNWTASGWVAKWTTFGAQGAGVGQFESPSDVYVDRLGRIYVADTGNNRIVRMDDMSGRGWVTLGAGGCGDGPLQFCKPRSVSVLGTGQIYITAELCWSCWAWVGGPAVERVIRVDDMTGANWTQIGSHGAGVGQFHTLTGGRYDGAYRFFVHDLFNYRVVRMDDISGLNWAELDLRQTCVSNVQPGALALDQAGRIYLGGNGLFRLNDISGGGCVRAPPIYDSQRQTHEWFADGIAIDSAYRIYTTDGHAFGASRIRRMNDMNGNGWITLGRRGGGVLEFEFPQGIFVEGREPAPYGGP